MNRTTFEAMAVRLGGKISRRKFIGRLAGAGTGAPLAVALGRTRSAAAQTCAYGPGTCQQGYVWREAYAGDKVCVEPSQRDQAYADNAAAPDRVDPFGAYGPQSCVQGHVWREANPADLVCVEPWVRDQVAADNAAAAARVEPGCDGSDGSGLEVVDELARSFLAESGVPGFSIAIAKDGNLVVARAYGVADPATGEAVTPDHRFRIASVTKPITSVAIMGLMEGGRLSLDDRVFGEAGLLGSYYGTEPYPDGLEEITVQHLLEHTAGGWSNQGDDPMYAEPDLYGDEFISWVLDNTGPGRRFPLDHAPGTNYSYSNFGYCLLGRVIESVSGQAYDEYVREAVLAPCGIYDMEIAGDSLAERRDDEVVYDGSNAPASFGRPYEIPVARMDSHGGWIATATDLLRFATRVDRFATVPDILADATIATMTTPSTAKPAIDADHPGYAKGWSVNVFDNWWHDGALAGTQSFLVRSSDGFCWAALANGNGIDLETMVWRMIETVRDWPSGDPL